MPAHKSIEHHIKAVLDCLGLDVGDPSIQDTPRRVAAYLLEFCQKPDWEKVLGNGFDNPEKEGGGLVTQDGIPFRMICEHHLLPATGHASIGYIPRKKVIGLSKLPRLVDAVGTMRPSLQETITDKIADLLKDNLDPQGVIVVIKAEHSCMGCRGVRTPGVMTTTSSVRGIFRDVPEVRAEFFSLVNMER